MIAATRAPFWYLRYLGRSTGGGASAEVAGLSTCIAAPAGYAAREVRRTCSEYPGGLLSSHSMASIVESGRLNSVAKNQAAWQT